MALQQYESLVVQLLQGINVEKRFPLYEMKEVSEVGERRSYAEIRSMCMSLLTIRYVNNVLNKLYSQIYQKAKKVSYLQKARVLYDLLNRPTTPFPIFSVSTTCTLCGK